MARPSGTTTKSLPRLSSYSNQPALASQASAWLASVSFFSSPGVPRQKVASPFNIRRIEMYLDTATLVAVLIALVSQLIMIGILFRSAYLWEQRYKDVCRLIKIERAARR